MYLHAEKISKVCENIFDLESAELSPSYYYDSLPLCIIDAVYSMGTRYTSTKNVVKNYCEYCGISEFRKKGDRCSDCQTVSDLIDNITSLGIEESINVIFKNRQRTSTRNGILKAEAVLRVAEVFQKFGIETLKDFSETGISDEAEKEIRKIPGQKSGLSLRYLHMLAGDDTQSKPDRHILRFLKEHTEKNFSVSEAQELLTETVIILRRKYPGMTVRLLDYTIWNYMAHRR